MPNPRLSVIVATDRYDTIRGVVAALRRQHEPGLIELVVAIPHEEAGGVRGEELSSFAQTTVVGVDSVRRLAPARAAAIRAAHAPFVFMGETHSFPEPGFVEAVLAAFEGPWAAVVPAVLNANPFGLSSWTAYAFDYASWGPHRPSGPIGDPLIYNTAYRRDVLLSIGVPIEQVLDHYRDVLWPSLRAAGHRAWFAADARLRHLNVSTLHGLLTERFASGASVGMQRSADWPWTRRALYAAASPLIALVLFTRLMRGALGAIPPWRRPAVVPALLLAAVVKAAGELAGYIGMDLQAVVARGVDYEIHKARYAGRGAP
jgi:hypothetical protein